MSKSTDQGVIAAAADSGATLLHTDIDFDQDGKQCGFLRLPHSVTRSAYGWLPVPLVCVQHGTGPTVLLMSGVHGDEFEGQIALTKLVRTLTAEQVAGRVIILPMANFPAARAGERVSPIDDCNMNRIFPGHARGSSTYQLTHYIETQLMPLTDYVFDLHSGGSSLHYLPMSILGWSQDEAARAQQVGFATAFGTDFGCFFPGDHAGTSSSAATRRQGATGMTVEIGGSGSTSPDTVARCEQGIARLLHHLGVVEPTHSLPDPPRLRIVQAMTPQTYVFAPEPGLFEPAAALGDEVEAGQLAGFIQSPQTPWNVPEEIRFEASGTVICVRAKTLSERGDCLYHLGSPLGTT